MKFNKIQIRPMAGEWQLIVTHDPTEREHSSSADTPNALGWYYCPETTPPIEGVNILRKCMIARHQDEIALLQAALSDLTELEVPENCFAKIPQPAQSGAHG